MFVRGSIVNFHYQCVWFYPKTFDPAQSRRAIAFAHSFCQQILPFQSTQPRLRKAQPEDCHILQNRLRRCPVDHRQAETSARPEHLPAHYGNVFRDGCRHVSVDGVPRQFQPTVFPRSVFAFNNPFSSRSVKRSTFDPGT